MSLVECGEAKEIKFPVPYGFLAGKEWGFDTDQCVLALHGWLDNASSFDLLIPYLPSNIKLVAMDYPGHGYSSHLPLGAHYSRIQMMMDVRRFVKHLGWEKFSIIGHSLGGSVGLMYSVMYPEEVERFVSLEQILLLDIFPLLPLEEVLDGLLLVEDIEATKRYSSFAPKEALKKMRETRIGIAEKGLELIFFRGSQPSKKDKHKMEFVHDTRLKLLPMIPLEFDHPEEKVKVIEKIRTPLLMILNDIPTLVCERNEENKNALKIYEQKCPFFKLVEIAGGGHYIHTTEPEKVGELITDFLRKTFTK